jgi:kynurenine formamidase
VAEFLVKQRSVKAVGIDTPSIDHGPSRDFQAHRVFGEANVPIFENVASLEQIPQKGATIFAIPMKIKGGSGAPLRIFAVLP